VKQKEIAKQETVAEKIERIPEIVPVLPVRDIVVYPAMIVPLFVGRDKSVLAVEEALAKEIPLLLLTQRSATVDDPGPDDLFLIGTASESLQPLRLPGQRR